MLNRQFCDLTWPKGRKLFQAEKERLEEQVSDLRTQLKQREQRIFSAEEEISLLRDKSGGATKALSKVHKHNQD